MTAAADRPDSNSPGSASPESETPSPMLRQAIVLGLLIAVGAFAIDMYIPGFAAIARDLRTDAGAVQLSMTSFFVALAVGQIIYGPISDAVGRRGPVFAGLAVFALGCAGAMLAQDIGALIFARFVQGLGAAATAVVPMAMIRDQHTGPQAAKLLALAMASLSVSPILAPVLGGLLVQATSWRLIFLVLIAITAATAVLVARALPETLPPSRRVRLRPTGILATYKRLLADPRFLAPILVAAFGQAVLFLFVAGAPQLFVTLHGLNPTWFGLLFACHAMCLIGTLQLNAPMLRWLGTRRLVGAGTLGLAVFALAFLAAVLAGDVPFAVLVGCTLAMFVCMGLVLGPAFLSAMEPFGAVAGAAAALGAAVEFTTSSTMTFLMGVCADGTARPMAIFTAIAAVATVAGWLLLRRSVSPPGHP